MKKVAIVYWSGTGNTEAMAHQILAGVVEEGEFQPMWDSVVGKLGGKKIALFGSYGWGDGEWMRNWEEENRDCKEIGRLLAE